MDEKYRKLSYLGLFSFITAGLITILTLLYVKEYEISLVNKEISDERNIFLFYDLDKDGVTERIRYLKDNFGQVGLIAYYGEQIVGQWNFRGEWGRMGGPLIGDYDQDGYLETFIFSVRNDSLFVHCVDPLNNKIEFQDRFITLVKKFQDDYDFSIFPGEFYDSNGDGFAEVYFAISSAYSTEPRNIVRYDPVTNIASTSPNSCAPLHDINLCFIQPDSVPLFYSSTSAFGNCDSSRSYSDMWSWVMVFNSDLSFSFPPIKLNAYPARTNINTIVVDDTTYFFLYCTIIPVLNHIKVKHYCSTLREN